jgi:ATP-binding cassette subfamily C protein
MSSGNQKIPRQLSLFRAYLREFMHFDPAAIRHAVVFNLAAALTEGAGLMLLLPLLTLAGVLGKSGDEFPMASHALASMGVRWNIESALIAFVFLIAMQSWLVLLRDRVCNSLQLRFADHLRQGLYASIAGARWSFFTERHSGEFLNVLTSEVQRISSGTYFLLRFSTFLFLGFAYVLVALRLSVGLTLLALATGFLLWVLLRGTDGATMESGVLLGQANRSLFTRTQDFLSAMKLVKIHGEEAGSVSRFNHAVEEASSRFIEYQKIRTGVQLVYRVGGACALALLSYVALTVMELTTARLLVMIAIFARMLPQLSEIAAGRQQLLHMLPAFAAWRTLMDDCEAHRGAAMSHGDAVPLLQGIAFEKVVFRHGLSHHSLRVRRLFIPAKKTTAIIGVSGSGKTTLLDLLSGLLSPDSGTIAVDGIVLRQLSGWRKSIAYIPQETMIQNGTVRDNLGWGNDAPSDVEIERALSQAALVELARKLPRGLDTEVGERGVKLSGGEKQRLALARALLRRPQLLILDEATSALDTDNHRLVHDAIRALHGSMTVLVVTHRHEELAGLVDGIVRVEDGEVGAWQPVENET